MAKGKKTGGGTRKGRPNKATADVRAAVALLAETNIGKVHGWLERGARTDPLGAARVFAQLLEYHVPKLARTEVTGKDGGPVRMVSAAPHDTEL